MKRYCTSCGTQLPGKGHGWPKSNGGLVCGRGEVQKSVRTDKGFMLATVKTPECRP